MATPASSKKSFSGNHSFKKRHLKMVVGGIIASSALVFGFQNCADTAMFAAIGESVVGYSCVDSDSVTLQPKMKWDWYAQLDKSNPENYPDYKQVMSTPVVANLDNQFNSEVVFVTFKSNAYHTTHKGVLRIVDGATGRTLKSVGGSAAEDDIAPPASMSPLLIDLDGDGKLEIIYPNYKDHKKIVALNYDGSLRWVFNAAVGNASHAGLSTTDINKDGKADILLRGQVITENASRQPVELFSLSGGSFGAQSFAYPLDQSRPTEMHIITSAGVFDYQGSKLYSFSGATHIAVADVYPEVEGIEIVTSSTAQIQIFNGLTGQLLKSVAQSELGISGGGAPSIGNFDENPDTLEIAITGGNYLAIFDAQLKLMAKIATKDVSSLQTGLASTDLNGDRKAEIIYADEEYFRIYQYENGQFKVISQIVNPSGTLLEKPILVNIDHDRDSEIIIASNNYAVGALYLKPEQAQDKITAAQITGVRAFEADTTGSGWMPTRGIQHQYWYNPAMVTDTGKATSSIDPFSYLTRTFGRNSILSLKEPVCTPIMESGHIR